MAKKIKRLCYDPDIKEFLLGEFIKTEHRFSDGSIVWARVLVWDIPANESVVYFQTKRSTFGDMVMMPIAKEDANYE